MFALKLKHLFEWHEFSRAAVIPSKWKETRFKLLWEISFLHFSLVARLELREQNIFTCEIINMIGKKNDWLKEMQMASSLKVNLMKEIQNQMKVQFLGPCAHGT
jgi:hypothetical protein